jgi:hypothetical protein
MRSGLSCVRVKKISVTSASVAVIGTSRYGDYFKPKLIASSRGFRHYFGKSRCHWTIEACLHLINETAVGVVFVRIPVVESWSYNRALECLDAFDSSLWYVRMPEAPWWWRVVKFFDLWRSMW